MTCPKYRTTSELAARCRSFRFGLNSNLLKGWLSAVLTVSLEEAALARLIRAGTRKLVMSADVSRERDEATECRPGAP